MPTANPMLLVDDLKQVISRFPTIKLAILFGSIGRDQANPASDLDIAIAANNPLSPEDKIGLIEEFALLTGRPIDLIDLRTADGLILRRILTTGRILHCTDHSFYAEIIKKMLFDRADFMPYRQRILAERRSGWIAN